MIDLTELLFKPVTYSALFDPITGEVLSVGPSTAFPNKNNVVPVEKEIAEMIIEGDINIIDCAVDVRNMTFEIVEKKIVSKIDDVLHRVIDVNWTTIDNPDIYVTYDKDKSMITVELTEEFNGTHILPEKYQPVVKRNIIWNGDTKLNFYVTEYNDPNILYSKFDVLLKDLVDSKIVITDLEVPEKFSIYTRRVLKNYVLEIK